MTKLSTQQINDIESQVHLIANICKSIDSFIFTKEKITLTLKRNSFFNAIARHYGFTSWSHLKIANKNTKDSHKFVQIFDDTEQAKEFLFENIEGLDNKTCSIILSYIPFKEQHQFPYIAEVCDVFELSVIDLAEEDSNHNPAFVFYDSGDSSVGIPSFYSKLQFDSKENLEWFISANIKEIRNTYLDGDFDTFEKIISPLEERG